MNTAHQAQWDKVEELSLAGFEFVSYNPLTLWVCMRKGDTNVHIGQDGLVHCG